MYKSFHKLKYILLTIVICLVSITILPASSKPDKKPIFRIIAFFSARSDRGHISFVHEANRWFSDMALKYNFIYDTTRDWNNLNPEYLSGYQVVIFLDSRPDSAEQRDAFRGYMENGGAWMGFHFAAFSLTPSAFPQNWDWYHNQFLGCGEYNGNTWRPTSAVLHLENRKHPAIRHLPETFVASPNEWYKWEKDLRTNPDIKILLSIDSTSFPLGTGPKQYEIWHNGYYPVAWNNINYKMVYINMGHNDIDYENKSNKELSFTFCNKTQNKLILNLLFWLGKDR